jgi:hypothetical protein
VCAPAVLFVAATIPGGWFSADMIAFSPVLGALVGMGCGTVGWLVTLWAAKQHARPEQT